ncbi:MAG: hypothetical protein ACK6CT_11480 [Planctomycetia bacterium]
MLIFDEPPAENLVNVANHITVIAVVAIGMKMVIIAVIQNGLNLTIVERYTQKVVFGLVIVGAVLLDRVRHRA